MYDNQREGRREQDEKHREIEKGRIRAKAQETNQGEMSAKKNKNSKEKTLCI